MRKSRTAVVWGACAALSLSLAAPPAWSQAVDEKAKSDAFKANAAGSASAAPGGRANPDDFPEIKEAIELFKKGDGDGAMKKLQQACDVHPELSPPGVLFAILCIQSNQLPQGRAYLERAAIENFSHPDVYRTFGDLAFAEGRITDALVQYEKSASLCASERYPAKQRETWLIQANNGLANIYERRADWRNAYATLKVLLDLTKGDPVIRWRMAKALFFLDKRDDAAENLRQAAAAKAEIEPADVTLGFLCNMKKDFAGAEKHYREAIASKANDVRCYVAFANWLLSQNRLQEAVLMSKQALKLEPKAPAVRILNAVCLRQTKDLDGAEKLLQDLHTELRSNVDIKNQLALVLVEQKDPAKRRQALDLALENAKLNQNSVEAAMTYAWALYQNGRVEEADKALRAIIGTGQANSDCAYYLALIDSGFDDAKKVDEAVLLLKKAVDTTGTFVHREDAVALLRKLEEKKASKK